MSNETIPYITCMTDNVRDLFHFALNGVMTTLFVLCGTVGTIYSCSLLAKQHTRFAKHIFALCLWDMAVLLSAYGFYGGVTMIKGGKTWTGPFVYLYLIFYPICNWTLTGSKWMVLTISVERYFAFSDPFRQRIREAKPVGRWLCLIAFMALIYSIPSLLELETVECYDPVELKVKPQIWMTDLRRSELFCFIYRVVINSIFGNVFPFLIVLFLSLKTLFIRNAVHEDETNVPLKIALPIEQRGSSNMQFLTVTDAQTENQRRRSSASRGMRTVNGPRATTMLSMVIVKYLICYSLPTAMNVMEFIDQAGGNNQYGYLTRLPIYGYLVDVSNFLVVLHSASNWLLYCHYRNQKKSREPLENSQSTIRSRRNTEHLLSSNPKLFDFNDNQLATLGKMWNNIDSTELGINMLKELCKEKDQHLHSVVRLRQQGGSAIIDSFHEDDKKMSTVSQLHFLEQRYCYLGRTIGDFLEEIIKLMINHTNDRGAICQRIRHAGYSHFQHSINLRNSDWFIIKKVIVEGLIENNTDQSMNNGQEIARTFAAFFVGEMKFGFLAKAFMENS